MKTTTRPYNFGAGPATLPEPVLLQAQSELLNWHDRGMSIMEIGHRTPIFTSLLEETEALLRELLAIPKNYHVLFLGMPARTQFAMIPMNLLNQHHDEAGYLVSGTWSAMAYEECQLLKRAYCVAKGSTEGVLAAPSPLNWEIREQTAYVYYTPNETINGVRFPEVPQFGDIPLIADMTSCLLAESIRVEDYGLIFAGAQKNLAPAGLTVVIVREDLVGKTTTLPIPTMLNYQTHVTHHSVYATPPTFNCYMMLLVLKWLKSLGGLAAMHALNVQKAQKLYDFIDAHPFYHCRVEEKSRSKMNVCFQLENAELEPVFLTESAAAGLLALKGHRLIGGLRASLYNAMPIEGVEALIQFMQTFAEAHGS